MSASLGPALVPDAVKTERQLTFVCLVFSFWLLSVLGVKNMEDKKRMDGTERYNATLRVTLENFKHEAG